MATVANVNIHLGILYRLWLNISKAPDEPQQDLTSFILQDPIVQKVYRTSRIRNAETFSLAQKLFTAKIC